MSIKKALLFTFMWVCLALAFNAGIYVYFLSNGGQVIASQKALEFLGGYIIEQSLSLDNLFLFILIFTTFGVESKYQRRALNYGIIGAMILRLIFIVLGVAMVSKFEWILYIFGGILIISGIKMMMSNEDEKKDFNNTWSIRLMKKIIPITDKIENEKFFIKKDKILYATPLLAVLVVIETSDIIFAIDSIPAVFSITTDSFIVYTSNIFAILGLRSMYFVLEKLHSSFCYVKYGVACILAFTGVKLLGEMWHWEISILASIGIIFGILLISILASMFFKPKCLDNK